MLKMLTADDIEETWPGQFPRMAGDARNCRKDGKFHKSDQMLNQAKRNINKLCLRKISLQKTLGITFSVYFGFSNELYGKKTKTQKRRKSTASFLN